MHSFTHCLVHCIVSIGISGIDDTVRYIGNQEEHHRNRTFREEFEGFLRKHDIPFEAPMLD